jgi:tetratricopeptide (TPR) repeat protein
MIKIVGAAALLLVASTVGGVAPTVAHEDGAAGATEKLGTVRFATSCSPAVEETFNRGMAMFHSFWFDPAASAFAEVARADPSCAMAYWGIALTRLGNPFAWPPAEKQVVAGQQALARARTAEVKTQRERAYIAALGAFYDEAQTIDHRTRAVAFERALASMAERYPDDVEATILYALVLNGTALASDKTYAQQLKAAAILEPVVERYPDHPGVVHYLIHSYDYPPVAERGLPAARRYADLAPSAPHALHMPGHIFTRLGYWDESIETNRRSAAAAKAELSQTELGQGSYNALHAMDYMVYAYLQQARDAHAKALVDEMRGITRVDVESFPAAFAFAASPARYVLERGDWAAAAQLTLHPATLAWQKFPQAEAVSVFARALGAARSGDLDRARAGIDRLRGLEAALVAAKQPFWADQVGIQAEIASAWLLFAEDKHDAAVALMRKAADREDATDKHPVTPGPLAPARELLGEMLLDGGRPADALAEFERSQQKEPNRLRGYYGVARAAELAGRADVARANYAKLLDLTRHADGDRTEIVKAQAFVERN